MNLIERIEAVRQRCPLTEQQVLVGILHERDRGADWTRQGTYLVYRALGEVLAPARILEIGSRLGYSLWALFQGSRKVRRIWAFDSEDDLPGSFGWVRKRLCFVAQLHLSRVDTQELTTLDLPEKVDLAHVDALHTEAGTYHDCVLAAAALAEGGVLAIDDIKNPEVKAGADRFCADFGQEPQYLECYRGMHLIQWKK